MGFLLHTLVRTIYTALLGLAVLGWVGAAAGTMPSTRPATTIR